jgi:hypothetical protein
MASGKNNLIEENIGHLLPFEVSIVAGSVTFKYGNYTPITANISDPTGNWRTPKTLRFRFTNTGASGTGYGKDITIQNFKFYKDNSVAPNPNNPPIANAGADKIITLPTNSTTLSGSGTDADGAISSYSWVKISGPTTSTIANANAASTLINNLVQGVYQYELTVTDNNGATGKDTIRVTVDAASNQAPVVNAGTDQVITLPVNNATLTGSGTDADGTISSYSWVKISGPATGTIANANAASTLINNLVQGVYQYELTVTDNNGATGKDTIRVTVNAASNQTPVVNAGTDQVITLPVNNATLTGSGTDADGTISSYSWVKISGPTTGAIANANAASTLINNLVQGGLPI